MRTDLVFGLRSGGSVAHTSGVVAGLARVWAPPVVVASDLPEGVSGMHCAELVRPDPRFFWDQHLLLELAYNETFYSRAMSVLAPERPGFVYQRYSTGDYSGALVARDLGVPYVLEFNGSEVWIGRNWGKPLPYELLMERIELADLHAADLIVVVSAPIRAELEERGIDPAKVLVNPNGVDIDIYSPGIDGAPTRRELGLDGKTVVGFIGTFGRWHGAEVLIDGMAALFAGAPMLRESVRLLLVGDGQMMPEVRRRIAAHGLDDVCVLTGSVPQSEGPRMLAACDLYASPHVPNADGTEFFGSPTKLFEYMAMGRGIVASRLGQIGEVLEHGRTAWLVEPGDAQALGAGLKQLVTDVELRNRLGREARRVAVECHSWEQHTRRIVDALVERCG